MALTLASAEDQVRALTRHVGDTTRLTQPNLRLYLNHACRQLRTWLREKAPRYYLLTSSDQPVTAGGTVTLATVSAILEAVHRVDRKVNDCWVPMEAADPLNPNEHQAGAYTWREENALLYFGPDALFSGTVRVLYHVTVADISSGSFAIPAQLELPLIYRACGLVALDDQEGAAGKKGWDELADADLDKALPGLRKAAGIHPHTAGLRRVMGY